MPSIKDKAASSDSVAIELNGEAIDATVAREDLDQSHLEDCKGPDPEHWDDPAARDEPEFHPGDPDEVRHDDPLFEQIFAGDGSWTVEVTDSTQVSHVKGPGPEWA